MRAPSARLAALVLGLIAARPLHAEHRPAIETARDIWGMIQQLRGDHDSAQAGLRPQALPPAGPGVAPVDLSDLSHPARLESRLVPLSRLTPARMRVTVAGGQARLGAYSVGSEQTVQGHLLVLRGNADVYGRVQGNVVTVDGDVIVHTGAVIQGDVLAIHGKVREQGGVVDGEIRTLSAGPATAAVPLSPMQLTLRRFAGLAGVVITLSVLGLGLVAFGRHNLEIVSDTVSRSFGR